MEHERPDDAGGDDDGDYGGESRNPSAVNESRSYSPSATIVESSRLIPWMMLSAVLAGISLSLSIVMTLQVLETKREVRFQQLKIDEYRMALLAAGIDPNPHLKGEMR